MTMDNLITWTLMTSLMFITIPITGGAADDIPGCPSPCKCSWDLYYNEVFVDCANKGLTALPTSYPTNTTHVNASTNNLQLFKKLNLSTLKQLILSNNKLRGLPEALGTMPMLNVLDLGNNELSALGDNVFRGLNMLETLVLSGNSLNSIPNHTFSALRNLKMVDLRDGNAGILDSHVDLFLNLPSLEEVYLHEGNTKTLKSSLFKGCPRLKNVFYDGVPSLVDFSRINATLNIIPKKNNLTGVIFPKSNIAATEMNIDFSLQTQVTDISVDFSALKNVSKLSISFDGLKGVSALDKTVFESRNDYQMIDFSEVPLRLQGLRNLTSGLANATVDTLTLSNIKLFVNTTSDLSLFGAIKGLADLELSLNDIKTIDPGIFSSVTSLKRLMLQSTGIEVLTGVRYFEMENLEILDISGNSLSFFDFANTLRKCGKLRELYVSHNVIRHSQPILFPANQMLQSLHLDYNQLTGALNFSQLKSLGDLSLEGIYPRIQGTIPTFNVTFNGLSKLRSLNLGQNGAKLPLLVRNMFGGLISLKTLVLAGNSLMSMDATSIGNSFKDLSALEELDLPANGLAGIGSDVFAYLPGLVSLDLADNKLSTLPEGVFKPLRNLRKLDLAYNVIFTFSSALTLELENINELQINGNSFRCECDLRPFSAWLKASPRKHRRVDGAQQPCTSPIEYKTSRVAIDSFTLPWIECDGNKLLVVFLVLIPVFVIIALLIWRYCKRRGLCRRRKYVQFDDTSGIGTIRF